MLRSIAIAMSAGVLVHAANVCHTCCDGNSDNYCSLSSSPSSACYVRPAGDSCVPADATLPPCAPGVTCPSAQATSNRPGAQMFDDFRLTSLGPLAGAFPDHDPTSKFHDVPAFLIGLPISVPGSTQVDDYTLKFECPAFLGVDCDAYILIYECAPCVSRKGGLPGELVAAGWERTRCAPTFSLVLPNKRHRMTAFRYRLSSGSEISATIDDPVDYIAYGRFSRTTDCSVYTTMATCEVAGFGDYCKWDLATGTCVFNKCIPLGPGPGCLHCVADELTP